MDSAAARSSFPSTSWSLVARAGDADGSAVSRAALAALCQAYWFPVYAFLRRSHASSDAQDLAQGFFLHLLEHDTLIRAARERGRFRNFLLGSLRHYSADQRDRARAGKRGGGIEPMPIQAAEQRLAEPDRVGLDDDVRFDADWAVAQMDAALAALRAEYGQPQEQRWFQALQPLLSGSGLELDYRHLAQQLDSTEAAVKTAVHRLRRRYRELLRQQVAATVRAPHEVDGELRHLLEVMIAVRAAGG
jgi:RNA polymerase sigma-70 factor (ECF subfamily)